MTLAKHPWPSLDGSRFSERSFMRIWMLALAVYGVGDIVTTVAIVWFVPSLVEANPVVRLAIETVGPAGFVVVKLLAFYACLAISLWGGIGDDDSFLFYGPPVALVLVGAFATASNLSLLFG